VLASITDVSGELDPDDWLLPVEVQELAVEGVDIGNVRDDCCAFSLQVPLPGRRLLDFFRGLSFGLGAVSLAGIFKNVAATSKPSGRQLAGAVKSS
jgi:hypothetical protein